MDPIKLSNYVRGVRPYGAAYLLTEIVLKIFSEEPLGDVIGKHGRHICSLLWAAKYPVERETV
jgi:hypothetical protein